MSQVTIDEYVIKEGKRIFIGFRDSDGNLYLQRCPECNLENYAMAVASGQCAWCGWKENEKERGE